MKKVGPTKYGPRILNGASLTLAVPTSLPSAMRGPVVELKGLTTRPGRRGMGDAEGLLMQTTVDADVGRYFLFLHVEPADRTTRKEGLVDLYARHGFVPIQADPLLMVRPPVGAMQHGRV